MNCCYFRGRRVEVGVWVKRSARPAAGMASSQDQVHQSLCPPQLLGFERNVLLVREAAANPRHCHPRVLPVSNLRSRDSSLPRNDQTASFAPMLLCGICPTHILFPGLDRAGKSDRAVQICLLSAARLTRTPRTRSKDAGAYELTVCLIACSVLSTAGNVMVISRPPSCAFAASTLPPCRITACFVIDSPSPTPPVLRSRESSSR